MSFDYIENPEDDLLNEIDSKINQFNLLHWEVKERKDIALVKRNNQSEIEAAASAQLFGYWLLIKNIWVSENLRGQNIGSNLLENLEQIAVDYGCKYALLDTLNFQAESFYKKFGYEVQWIQKNYPKTGCKYFMTKKL